MSDGSFMMGMAAGFAFGNFTPAGQPYWNRGGWLVGFLLFFLLGWAVFGFMIQGPMR
jgi:hypothetical protein